MRDLDGKQVPPLKNVGENYRVIKTRFGKVDVILKERNAGKKAVKSLLPVIIT